MPAGAAGPLHGGAATSAAATVATLLPDRFVLGLGSGERLNEQITGERWPPAGQRRDWLAEAVEVIRRLLAGEELTYRGRYVTVEHAQLFTRPPQPPPIMIAASGRRGAALAGQLGDGLIAAVPNPDLVDAFEAAGGRGKPRIGQLHLCWAATMTSARKTALQYWPIAALPGPVLAELARPAEFAHLAELVNDNDIGRTVVCGPEPEPYLDAILRYATAGFSHLYLHQIGPDQAGFRQFYTYQLAPALAT